MPGKWKLRRFDAATHRLEAELNVRTEAEVAEDLAYLLRDQTMVAKDLVFGSVEGGLIVVIPPPGSTSAILVFERQRVS